MDTLEQAIYGIWILSDRPNVFNANGFGNFFVFVSLPFYPVFYHHLPQTLNGYSGISISICLVQMAQVKSEDAYC